MSDERAPRVSVLMTLYNKGPFVERAVRSVLENSFSDFELLVVDDASTDGGVERVRSIADPRIKILLAERNRGRPAAANRGYDAARGEYVAVLDADDEMRPDRLMKQVAFMDANPSIGACGTLAQVHGVKEELWKWPAADEECRGKMLFSDPLWYGSAMFRRSVLEEHHLRCNEGWMRPGMDFLFLVSLAPHLRFANIQEPLTLYRVGEQNMRHGRDPMEDRAGIYREQFRIFHMPVSEEEIRLQLIFHRLYRKPPSRADVVALMHWRRRLAAMNRELNVFPIPVFEAELEKRWQRIFHPIADHDLPAAFAHLFLGGGWSFSKLRYLALVSLRRFRLRTRMAEPASVDTPPAISTMPVQAQPRTGDRSTLAGSGGRATNLPRITLVTPSFQQAAYLEECIASVHSQDYPNLEHIVVDGGSTDGSLGILAREQGKFAWWCSEPDTGQSDAIAKGALHGTGQVFGWLNSDDVLLPGALRKVGEAFAADPDMVVLCGARILRKADADIALPLEDTSDPEAFYTAPRINQQSTFYRMDTVREAGLVEPKLDYVMDYELWLQVLFRNGPSGVRSIPDALAVFRHHAGSKTATVHHRFLDETASVLHGLCATTGQSDLMRILESGHVITPGLRAIPLHDPTKERARVRCMVIAFLLKWHYTIWTARDFHMMRKFRRTIELDPGELGAKQRAQLEILDGQVNVPGWLAFRMKRKWKHLVR